MISLRNNCQEQNLIKTHISRNPQLEKIWKPSNTTLQIQPLTANHQSQESINAQHIADLHISLSVITVASIIIHTGDRKQDRHQQKQGSKMLISMNREFI